MNKNELIGELNERIEWIVETFGSSEKVDGFKEALGMVTLTLDGMAIVPIEPTDEIINAMLRSQRNLGKGMADTYKAIIDTQQGEG